MLGLVQTFKHSGLRRAVVETADGVIMGRDRKSCRTERNTMAFNRIGLRASLSLVSLRKNLSILSSDGEEDRGQIMDQSALGTIE